MQLVRSGVYWRGRYRGVSWMRTTTLGSSMYERLEIVERIEIGGNLNKPRGFFGSDTLKRARKDPMEKMSMRKMVIEEGGRRWKISESDRGIAEKVSVDNDAGRKDENGENQVKDSEKRKDTVLGPRKSEEDEPISIGRRPPTNAELNVVFHDAQYLVIDKPFDVRMDGEFPITVQTLVLDYLSRNQVSSPTPSTLSSSNATEADQIKARNVHQLDYATSGILILALTKKAAAFACAQFERRRTKKCYLAIVYGELDVNREYFIDLPIAKVGENEFRMTSGTFNNPGRHASTYIYALEVGKYKGKVVTKVALFPITGRRHQLRVHCLCLGHPIVGDATYTDDSEYPFDDPRIPSRMMLHAYRLRIELLKSTGNQLFCAPDPFENVLEDVQKRRSESSWKEILQKYDLLPQNQQIQENQDSNSEQ